VSVNKAHDLAGDVRVMEAGSHVKVDQLVAMTGESCSGPCARSRTSSESSRPDRRMSLLARATLSAHVSVSVSGQGAVSREWDW